MPKPTIISATEMHKKRGEIIKRSYRNGEHFIVEKDGIPLVAIVPIQTYKAVFAPTTQPDDEQ